MNSIPQALLICGTVLYLLSLLIGFAVPALTNPRMGVSVRVAGLESGLTLWMLGLCGRIWRCRPAWRGLR